MLLDPDEVIERLDGYSGSLLGIVGDVERTRDIALGEERLSRWADRVASWLSKEVSRRVAAEFASVSFPLARDAATNFARRFEAYNTFLVGLVADIRDDPEYWEDLPLDDDDVEFPDDDGRPCVFIGHGRSPHWALVQRFIEKDLGLGVLAFESESRAGHHIVEVLDRMLAEADFAVIVLTAEDSTEGGTRRARQNVVHEAGLAQGRLGFRRAALIVQEGVEEFSNIAGLQQLRFRGDAVNEVFGGLRAAMEREGVV